MSSDSGLVWLVSPSTALELRVFDTPEAAERYAEYVDGIRWAPYAADHPRAPGYMRVSRFNV